MTQVAKVFINSFHKKNIHFFLILASFIMQMFNFGAAYRLFAYSNLLVVVITFCYQYKEMGNLKSFCELKYLIFFPLCFFILHFISVGNILIIKDMRHILLSVFIAIGVVMLFNKNQHYIKQNIFWLTTFIILIYVVIQATYLWVFNKPHGTTKNPHYLALYSSVSMIVAIYCFLNASVRLKWILGVSILLLGVFLIHTSSRPAWLALILTGIFTAYFLKVKSRRYTVLIMVVTLLFLTFSNVGNFSERTQDLIENVNTEERVTIWQETWAMQANSSLTEWAVGHGLDAFEENFKSYSSYHLKGVDFNSPHNYLLEILYLSGLLGILLTFVMFWFIYKELVCYILLAGENKSIYMVLMAVLTSNIIFTSITLPFFTSYNMNIIALVVGIMIYLRRQN